ncbi:hypothetical protein [Tautonia marina]|uniref:hypothetical protein n=1 Tax=Tautonia marina TaxID=2653855 RepID=UPI00126075AA|nr:hypothetical protein [Tautonia marina]
MTLLWSVVLGVLMVVEGSVGVQAPSGRPDADATDDPNVTVQDELPADLSDTTRERLELLENRLRVRDVRVREAERFLELERMILEENRRQQRIGGVAPRQVQILEVRVADAESQLEARQAEREQVAQMLDAMRRRILGRSPEPDVEELRAGIEGDLLASQIRLQAQEARLRAAELQVEAELASQENFLRAVRDGLSSPMALQQAFYRVADTRIWRDLMEAERDAARLAVERDQRRLSDFDQGNRDVETAVQELANRLRWLENEVQILRDENYFLEESRRRSRYGRHDRFGRTGATEP